jgi:probable HAF family extracellular repeat protein
LWDTTSTPQLLWTADISSGIYPGGSASAINNHGRIAGRAQFIPDQGFPLPGPGIPLGRAFVWDAASGVRLLGTLGGSVSQATGIDDAGRVVGSAEDLAGIPRAFLWDETHGMQDLGTLGGLYSFANAINNAGQVVGYSADENEQQHAFLWDPIAGMQNLGAGAFSGSRAFGVNSAGQVVGSLLDPGTRAFVWDSQVGIKLLDASLGHGTTAYAINDAGFVVGYSAGDRARASLWNPAGNAFALEDLIDPSLGWELEIAFDINNRGQIVGYGILNDQVRGFLMSPVPEPSTLALTAIGALALTVVAARSRTAH